VNPRELELLGQENNWVVLYHSELMELLELGFQIFLNTPIREKQGEQRRLYFQPLTPRNRAVLEKAGYTIAEKVKA